MNEDLKPCYDLESSWEMVPEGCGGGKQVFRHNDDHNLFRVIDFKNKTIVFKDTLRVPPSNVLDIYRDIGLKAKAEIIGLVLKIIDETKPIKMPYVHEELKVFIEYHADTVGILFYKDSDEDHSIIPIKRYFAIKRDPVRSFEEITWEDFVNLSSDFTSEEETKNVD